MNSQGVKVFPFPLSVPVAFWIGRSYLSLLFLFCGVKVFFGSWLIEGHPSVVLFDVGSVYHRLNEWKGDIWEKFRIPLPDNDRETNDSVVFGYLVSWFFGEV